MTNPEAVDRDHVTDDLLIRFSDDEVSQLEASRVSTHLSHCSNCKARLQAVMALSAELESLVAEFSPLTGTERRDSLVSQLDRKENTFASRPLGNWFAVSAGAWVWPQRWRSRFYFCRTWTRSAAKLVRLALQV